MHLYNRYSKKELTRRLNEETFKRRTISFYRYVAIDEPQEFRNELYFQWDKLGCLGRIYVAREGINAQMSVPEQALPAFLSHLEEMEQLKAMPIKYAIEDDGKSFYKLTIKVRPKIVADGLDERAFDTTNVGTHLSAKEFHDLVDQPDVLLVDMRNHYESEIGHFRGAICPEADTFREEIEMVVNDLKEQKERKILLYCTGGIRCEKASAYLRHHGFSDVNQLHGGIIEYARQIKQLDLESKFIGKNFVFDQRLGETVSGEVIAHCHQCGRKCDTHTNCANDLCHILFIQCETCALQYEGCCTSECQSVLHATEEERLLHVQTFKRKFGNRKSFRKSIDNRLKTESQSATVEHD
ncbi:rhodanese-related sulfurtransferase [uncultured Sunxiuqinia sp.]|uniref:oxygen-dependent tRNA uridine(34) hydroxylase TrhO n=1 Tax=Sunxiuqinia rutila TaxID=1397841 RepID=UPI00261C182B|nr:rhodanese-related sulfurtransferase [uncultured Sunxiuqinia sp.]